MLMQASEYTRESSIESITIPVGPRLGDIVVDVKGVTKAYGDRTLMENLSFSIPPGSIVGERIMAEAQHEPEHQYLASLACVKGSRFHDVNGSADQAMLLCRPQVASQAIMCYDPKQSKDLVGTSRDSQILSLWAIDPDVQSELQ